MNGAQRLPVIYLPHGGGPWHVMKEAFGDASGYERLESYLKELGARFRARTKAILVISAHWEEHRPTVHTGAHPGMLYDYYGFPDHTYKLVWPAPGAPELALRAEALLQEAGFKTEREEERGYDHGTFVPLMIAFPEASLPVAQLSLIAGLDPAAHLAMGAALEALRDEGVLIIGSGMSYHNLSNFMSRDREVAAASRGFDDWLFEAVSLPDGQEMRRRLGSWRNAPSAIECHPRSEHLVPLFVVAGAAGADVGRRDYAAELMGVAISSHIFGE